jgi:hypothetical protein
MLGTDLQFPSANNKSSPYLTFLPSQVHLKIHDNQSEYTQVLDSATHALSANSSTSPK